MKLNYIFPTIALVLFSLVLSAQTFPQKSDRLVNDYTQTLSAEQINELEQKLVAFDDSTSTQIAVILVKSLEGFDIADYGVRLAENWGIGGAKNNNGVLLLVAIDDRKVTIQTGYGVEGALPDAITKRIINNEITPNFKAGNYYAGLAAGTDAIISYTKGEYKSEKAEGGNSVFVLFFLFILVIIIIMAIKKGGGTEVMGSSGRTTSPLWWLLAGSQLGGGGSGGGFSDSGGGGGFGGFGGGSFGGGGSSGSW